MMSTGMSGRCIAVVVVCALAFFGARNARAAGIIQGVNATNLYVEEGITIPANAECIIETTNLSQGADTVLHVQYNGRFLDGNDDCATRLPGCTGLRSYVSVPVAGYARNVDVIVRAISTGAAGTATIHYRIGGVDSYRSNKSIGAGYIRTFSSIVNGAHFTSTEYQHGATTCTDSVILVTSQYVHRAAIFDDDSGVDLMSAAHMPELCSSECNVVVGGYPSGGGYTTLVWDEDADYLDFDQDGLSETLEAAIGTDDTMLDFDGDGLTDGEEVYGIETSEGTLKLPKYGAQPRVKDLFLEADWVTGTTPLSGAEAEIAHSIYAALGIQLHIDTGQSNQDSATWYHWNDWRGWSGVGATAVPTNADCGDIGVRSELFHHATLNTGASNGDPNGPCSWPNGTGYYVAHEVGHNMHLNHDGPVVADPPASFYPAWEVNCRPNAYSIMNYGYPTEPNFSDGSGAALLPTAMSETNVPLQLRNRVLDPTGWFRIQNPFGACSTCVDWNRDGAIQSGFVRAAPTWGFNGCAPFQQHMDDADRILEKLGTSFTRQHSGSALVRHVSGGTNYLYWFSVDRSTHAVDYRRVSNSGLPNGSQQPYVRTSWVPAVGQAATTVSGTTNVNADGIAAASYVDNGGSKLVLVWRSTTTNYLYAKWADGSWTPYWSPTTESISGSQGGGIPAAVAWNGAVHVYAPQGGQLKRWMRDAAGTWSGPVTQNWSDTGFPTVNVSDAAGIGVTAGKMCNTNTGTCWSTLVAAIPNSDVPANRLEVAYLDASARWTRLTTWTITRPFTNNPPAIAFVPFSSGASAGRFYVMYRDTQLTPMTDMMITEGNDIYMMSLTGRKFRVKTEPIMFQNWWYDGLGRPALFFDPAQDVNLHATMVNSATTYNNNFYPIADGILNRQLQDPPDADYVLSNLACSLIARTCPPGPYY